MTTKISEEGDFFFNSIGENGDIAIQSNDLSEIGRFNFSLATTSEVLIQSFEILAIQKIISVLKSTSGVTQFTGSGSSARISGAYAGTIIDYAMPSVTVRIIPSPGRLVTEAFSDVLNISLEIRMPGIGQNAYVWDDMVICCDAIVEALHRNGIWDSVIGIEVIEMTNIGSGEQIMTEDGMMVLASEWRIKGDVV